MVQLIIGLLIDPQQLLSAVKKTLSHRGMQPIGWNKFKKIVNKVNIPIYALGGLGTDDYQDALESGGIGIASQRLIWDWLFNFKLNNFRKYFFIF